MFCKHPVKPLVGLLLLVVLNISLPNIALSDSGRIYSIPSSGNTIRKANLENPSPISLVSSENTGGLITNPSGLALDLINGKIYWTNVDLAFIARSNILDGSGFEVLGPVVENPGAIALDVLNNRMFFTQPNVGKIVRADLNAGNQVSIIIGQGSPARLALDIPNGKIYWTDPSLHKIRRANFDGSNIEEVVALTAVNQPQGLALNLVQRQIYWTDVALDHIKRADLTSGLSVNEITVLDGVDQPLDIAVDLGAAVPKMYFVQFVGAFGDFFAFARPLAGQFSPTALSDLDLRSIIALELPCGATSQDSDGDLSPDCQDLCPLSAIKTAPLVCGCDLADVDSDQDGTLDCNDACLSDSNKTSPGICGCGIADSDVDADGLINCLDPCPNGGDVQVPGQPTFCSNGPVLTPNTIITVPPLVVVKRNRAIITLQNFAAVTDNVDVNQAARRLSVNYDVRLRSKNTLAAELKAKTIKRNRIVYKNLAPGTYSVRYRALIKRSKKTVSRTKFSPSAKFKINK